MVGLGVGEAHARALAAGARSELRLVHDLDRSRALSVARELGVEAAASYDEVLADGTVDAVVIASYDDAHFEQALAALRAGKHVFCEKPLCRTPAELRELRAALGERPGLVLRSNLVLRAAPLYRWLREECASGALGSLYAFDGDYLYGRVEKITEGWRKDVVDYSVIQGGGIHLVDLMLWLTGERPARVHAAGNRIATEGTDFRYLDYVAATFEFPSGLVGRVTANFGSVHRHQHVVRAWGTAGAFLYDDRGARVHRSRDPAEAAEDVPFTPVPPSKAALLGDFLQAVAGGDGSSPGADHEFAVISACIAADRSLAEGRPVDVAYP